MAKSDYSATTTEAGWEKQCSDWARTGVAFELWDFEMEHFSFCQRLCAEHGYTLFLHIRTGKAVMNFRPQKSGI